MSSFNSALNVWATFQHIFDANSIVFSAKKSFIVRFVSHSSLFNFFDYSLWHEDTDQSPATLSGWIAENIRYQPSAEQHSLNNDYVWSSRDAPAASSVSHAHQWIQLFLYNEVTWSICETLQWSVFVWECVLFWASRFFHKNYYFNFFIDKNGNTEVNESPSFWWWFGLLDKNLIPNNCY